MPSCSTLSSSPVKAVKRSPGGAMEVEVAGADVMV